ncbi:MAG: alpha/beta hydrolase [Phycisphaerales bacterium]
MLMVHGITSSRDELGLFSGLAQHLAGSGIPSFRFDYRCHGVNKRPTQFLTLSGVVNDIEAAARAAIDATHASRVHIVGMSFGGGLSAYWAATTRRAVFSVVMFAPVLDYEEDTLGQYDLLSDGMLTLKAARELKRSGSLKAGGIRYGGALLNELPYFSGLNAVSRLTCPCLIVHGDADSIVPFASSERVTKENPKCQLVNIPDTDHGFGVEGDEDLTSPETKEKHEQVFNAVSEFLTKVDT